MQVSHVGGKEELNKTGKRQSPPCLVASRMSPLTTHKQGSGFRELDPGLCGTWDPY
jgi:hypothetical protein